MNAIKDHLMPAFYVRCGIRQSTLCEGGRTYTEIGRGKAAVDLAKWGWEVIDKVLTCPACKRLMEIREAKKKK